MPTAIELMSKSAGLPPGTLVHVGEVKTSATRISVLRYSQAEATETDSVAVGDLRPPAEGDGVTWVKVIGLSDVATVAKVGQAFSLHPLILEDILNTEQRPKFEDLGEYIFFVLKTIQYDPATDSLDPDQISVVLGHNLVISFQEEDDAADAGLFAAVRQRILNCEGRIRTAGADYLAYRLVDTVIDGYFGMLEQLEDRLEDMEDAVVADPGPQTLHAVQGLKRHLVSVRKSVWPLREVIGAMQRRESPLITEPTGVFLRDVYDHTIQVIDSVETLREIISDMLDIYLSSVSNRLNEVMKILTIISTIFIPLSFVVGLYGMNFKHMPELEQPWGYPAVLCVMAGAVVYMLWYFRKKKWL